MAKNSFLFIFKFNIECLCAFFIGTGENSAIAYEELNVKIERICEWFYYACSVTILMFVLFPICYTGVAYYILDFGLKSFYLYPPTKFVYILI